jgi:MFS family permease
VYRLTISAVPFLLPLMFQAGFGWDPLRAGAMVSAVFVGNIGIKPATTPLIRRFGFKPVLVFASLASAATFALCALLDAGTPEALIVGVLVASGAFRSIGFSAYASVQYADVAPAQLPSANAVSATLVQLSTAAGIAVGALLLRVFEASSQGAGAIGLATGDPAAPYRAAFVAIAVLMLLSTLDSLALPRHAGAEVSRPGPTPTAERRRRPRA